MRALALLLLAGAWVAVAYALWQSRVPGGLDLPEVDLPSRIDPDVIARSKRYERFFRIEFVVSELVLIGVLLAYARWGIRFARESAAGRIGTGMLLGMIGLALAWSSQVPFRLAEVWWDRRYDQTEAGYAEELFANWLELGAEFLFVCFALALVMALAGRFPRRWWLAAAPVFVGLATLFAFIFPYLSTTEPLRRPQLEAAARDYAKQQGIDSVRVGVEDVTDFTSSPNAYAVGFGPSKRIVFWNTLLDGRFGDGEVKVVLAHELGHHSRSHIPESIGWYALFALPGTFLIALATRRRGGMASPAAVPLSLLVIVLLDLVSLPVYNVISRHMEQEADWVALETTRDPDSAAALFRNFTIESLNDPNPPTWSYLLFDSHPSVEQRIAMAEAWRAR
ncbi:MAG: M48 family metalloprotease, partial [Actinobacteria bacterium]|nr:M48 family metalloprotease [Actinomycetota bacterium]